MENITKFMRFAKTMMGVITIITMLLGFFWPMGFFYLGTLLAWVSLISLLLYGVGGLIKHYKGSEEETPNFFDFDYEEDAEEDEKKPSKFFNFEEESKKGVEYEGVFDSDSVVIKKNETTVEKSECDILSEEIINFKEFARDAIDLGDYEAAERWLEKAESRSLDLEKKKKEEAKAKEDAAKKAKEQKEKAERLRARLDKL